MKSFISLIQLQNTLKQINQLPKLPITTKQLKARVTNLEKSKLSVKLDKNRINSEIHFECELRNVKL